jgi:Flp pilus assembly protein protease CpaA
MPPNALLILIVVISLYDLKRGKVPNLVTLPLLCAGFLLNFPGSFDIWFSCMIIFIAWRASWISAGDAKLWMALFWIMPAGPPGETVFIFYATLFFTALSQIAWRKFKRQPLIGVRSPGAWRTIPFILWSLYVR